MPSHALFALVVGALVASQGASAAVPDAAIRGVVVQDVTQPFAFGVEIPFDCPPDGCGPYRPTPGNDFRGSVRQQVVRDTDGSFDFYFRVSTEPGSLNVGSFLYQWLSPLTDYRIAHHAFEPAAQPWPVDPFEGQTFSGQPQAIFGWDGGHLGVSEAVFVIDTNARAYARSGTYRLFSLIDVAFPPPAGAQLVEGRSPFFTAFAPAVPEPGTWALMLASLGIVALMRRGRRRVRERFMRTA